MKEEKLILINATQFEYKMIFVLPQISAKLNVYTKIYSSKSSFIFKKNAANNNPDSL